MRPVTQRGLHMTDINAETTRCFHLKHLNLISAGNPSSVSPAGRFQDSYEQ